MQAISALIRVLDNLTETIGRAAAWFSLAMVLVTCFVVVTRYVFNQGSIAVQESVIYLNGLLFILCAAYTLKHNGHVRVDVIYGHASPRYRAWVDLVGTLLLLMPASGFIIWISWDYVAAAWRVREGSGDAGGLPWVYLLKTLILVLGATLILQGVAEALRNIRILFLSGPGEPGQADKPHRRVEEGDSV